MSIFIIDYENVQSCSPFCGIDKVAKGDELYIFYSESAKNINEYDMKRIMQAPCKKHFYKLPQPGKNALDFCISVQVGKSLGENSRGKIAIISNDRGYKVLQDYISEINKSEKACLLTVSCIAEAMHLFALSSGQREEAIKGKGKKVAIGTIKNSPFESAKKKKGKYVKALLRRTKICIGRLLE